MKKPEPKKEEECKHSDTYPIAFFDEQETSNTAYLIVECDGCNSKFALSGQRLDWIE